MNKRQKGSVIAFFFAYTLTLVILEIAFKMTFTMLDF